MRRIFYLAVCLTISMSFSNKGKSQTNAMDFTIVDCNGGSHNLFTDLDAGKAVIIEFFMTSCGSCITAAALLEDMKANLATEFPGMVKAYAFGYNNSYTCSTVNNWVTTNGVTSFPSDSGATQVAYYGGMGMPTIVILGGGTSHLVLGTPFIGIVPGDTATMANDIRDFLNGVGISENDKSISDLNTFPNPVNDILNLSFNLSENSDIKIDIVDLTGRMVLNGKTQSYLAGTVNSSVDVSILATGNYLVKISVNGSMSEKMISVVR